VPLVPLKLEGATWGPTRAAFPDPTAPYVPAYVQPPPGPPGPAAAAPPRIAVAPLLEALFKHKAVEHSREYLDAFFEKLLQHLPAPATLATTLASAQASEAALSPAVAPAPAPALAPASAFPPRHELGVERQ
jgi:hypothetical protein